MYTALRAAGAAERQMHQIQLEPECQGQVVDAYCGIPVVPTSISCLIKHFVIENDVWKKHSISNPS